MKPSLLALWDRPRVAFVRLAASPAAEPQRAERARTDARCATRAKQRAVPPYNNMGVN